MLSPGDSSGNEQIDDIYKDRKGGGPASSSSSSSSSSSARVKAITAANKPKTKIQTKRITHQYFEFASIQQHYKVIHGIALPSDERVYSTPEYLEEKLRM